MPTRRAALPGGSGLPRRGVWPLLLRLPYRLMREVIEASITDQTIELFHQGARVASHIRNPR